MVHFHTDPRSRRASARRSRGWSTAAYGCLIALVASGSAATQTPKPDALVGAGGYKTVQAAIDAAPSAAQGRTWRIRVAPGTYTELVHVPRGKAPLAVVGDDPTTTKITFDRKATDLG